MACPAITTGSGFLSGTMAYLDCQARVIGSYGYGALAEPRSPVFAALTGLLTIFVALHGARLLLGISEGRAKFVGDIIKVGIVLTLATSWPAWRTIGYDLILDAPAELAQSIGLASGISDPSSEFTARLQAADDGIVAITSYGTGRLTGGVAAGNDLGDSFKGIALADQFALGMGRVAYLVGALVPFGIMRLGAGILLALAPLMAGLLLFGGANGIFFGWVRGLVFCAIGSLTQLMVQGVELALIEPWLQSVLDSRQSGIFTPSAPTELFVLGLVFAGIGLGLLFLNLRFVFFQSWGRSSNYQLIADKHADQRPDAAHLGRSISATSPSRAKIIADMVTQTVHRERAGLPFGRAAGPPALPNASGASPSRTTLLRDGKEMRASGINSLRMIGRASASAHARDHKS